MQASDKIRGSARRRRAVYSVAAVAGIAALVNMPEASRAANVVFNDTFGSSTLNGDTNTPTSNSTNYDLVSSKNTTTSFIAANDFQGLLTSATGGGTTSGGWEAQALFTTTPVSLVNPGDSIEETMVFIPNNIVAGGTSSTLALGLFNSHSNAPNNTLNNGGLTTATPVPYQTIAAANWEGYVSLFAMTGGNNQAYVRPVQNGSNTTTTNQDVLFNKAGTGYFNNPAASNVTSGVSSLTLTNGNTYTNDLVLTYNANGTVSINGTIYNGNTTGGSVVGSLSGLVNSPTGSLLSFDSLAFGAFNKGTSLNPQLDVSSLTIKTAAAATLIPRTWDPTGSGVGSDGSGDWETSNNTWAANGTASAWLNDGTSTAVIGSGGPAGTLTITVSNINAAGITFNSAYTVAAAGSNTLTLTAAPVNVASGATATITAPIAGNVGLSSNGPGSLVLTANNVYTGNTTISNGALIVNSGGTLGTAANGLVLGTSGSSTGTTPTNTGSLVLNTSATVGALTSSTNNTTANTIAINGSNVLTVNGVVTVGLSSSATTPPATALTITGNELDVNNTMIIGLAYTGSTTVSNTTLDMSGLTTFKMNATGTGQAFNFGAAQEAAGTVILASTANTITTNSINVGTTGNNSGRDTLELGVGTNVLNATTINIGTAKGSGAVQFAGSTGSVTIAGISGGTSTANISIGAQSTGTAASGTSTLNLTGHSATVQAGTVIVGQLNGSSNGTPSGSLLFDTGSMTIDSLQVANNLSGSAANGVVGAVTLGSDQTSTGVLTVNNSFTLANVANTAAASPATGTLVINGGTANIKSNITVGFASGALGTANTTLQLATGTLNMNGNEIGPVTATTLAITTVRMPSIGHSATLMNLGGGGINSSGLTMNGTGTLNLDGTNTYSGPTSVNAGGTLAVLSTSSLPSTSNVTVDGTLTLNNAAQSIPVLNGSTLGAAVNLNATNLTVAGGGSYLGVVNDNGSNGTLTAGGALSVGSFNVGAVNANANVQIQGTSKAKALNLTGGTGAWTSGLDLTIGKLILESTVGNKTADLNRLRDQVAFGKTHTDGIFTSTSLPAGYAIAVMDNAILNKGAFGGVGTTANSVLVGAELLGDANADGTIDTADLNVVLNHFGAVTKEWTSGNFDGAATIDLNDVAFVLNNFGANNPNATTAISFGGASIAIAAPEPAALAMLAAAAVPAMLGRRRRKA